MVGGSVVGMVVRGSVMVGGSVVGMVLGWSVVGMVVCRSVVGSVVDPDPYSEYLSGSTHANIG